MFEPTLERHIHRWSKIAGQPKAYCRFKGCTLTRDYYAVGEIPLTGNRSEPTFSGKRALKPYYECAKCGVFIDKTKPHVCDGAEGKAKRTLALTTASNALNRFFFEGRR